MPTEQLDPDVVNMAKAIRQSESGGDFTAEGDKNASHTSYGAYQFGEDTWNKTSKKYGVSAPLRQATPEQQNEVAYKQIKEWKDSGKNLGQVASMWNAGEGEPDAYLGTFSNGQPSVKKGKFDVPAYAKSVAAAYKTLKAGGQVSADPNNPSSIAAPQQAPQTGFRANHPILSTIADALTHSEQGLGQSIAGAIIPYTDAQKQVDDSRKMSTEVTNNLIKRIKEKKAAGEDASRLIQALKQSQNNTEISDEELNPTLNKSNEQILGEAGGTLADILSFGTYGAAGKIPTAIKGVTKAQGILQGVKAGAKSGAIIGGAQGVTGAMQNNGSVNDIATGGLLGGAIGGVSGGPLGGVGGLIAAHTPENAIAGLASKYRNIFNSIAPLRKLYGKASEKGNDLADFIASKARGVEGATLDVSSDGVVGVGELPTKIENDMQPLLDARKKILDSSGQTASLTEWEHRALKAADSSENRSQGVVQDTQNAIRKTAENVRSSYGENVPLGILQDLKIGQGKASRVFDMSKPNYAKNANYLLSNEARKMIEEKTPQLAEGADASAIGELNEKIGQHLEALDFLEQIHKSAPRVKGGRLGKYFASSLGAMVGGSMGGGPIGTLAGAGAGNYIAELLMSNSVSNPLKSLLFRWAKVEQPEILKTIEDLLSKQDLDRLERKLLPEGRQMNMGTSKNAPALDTSGIDKEGTKKLDDFYRQQAIDNTKRLPAPAIQLPAQNTNGIQIDLAKKGLPAPDPKTGRMFRTYTSETEGLLPRILKNKKK